MTRIAEADDRCGDTPVAGTTLCAAGFLGTPFIGLTALGEWPGLGFGGGSAFRGSGHAEALRSGPASGLTAGCESIAEDESESMDGTFARDLESRLLSPGFSVGRESSSRLLPTEELLGPATNSADEISERDSSNSAGGGAEDREGVWTG